MEKEHNEQQEQQQGHKLSYESDGIMGKDRNDGNIIKKMIPNDLFFNNTQDSE